LEKIDISEIRYTTKVFKMRLISVLIILLLPIIFSGCIQPQSSPQVSEHLATEKWVADGTIGANEYARSMTFFGPKTSGYSGGDLQIYWKNDAQFLYMAIAGNTTGWVSVGLEPEEWMKNADMILGFVDNGKAIVLDEFSTGNYGPHVPDVQLGGTNDILEFGGAEQNGRTTVEFKRKMDTGDKFDKAFTPGQKVSIIWAMADKDADSQKHNIAKGEGVMELQGGAAKPVSAATVSTGEKQGILFIREEEKAARDLYLTLYGQDNLSIFSSIAQSEQGHMDSVKVLIDKFGLSDSVQEPRGAFTNQSLKSLYEDLLRRGGKSPEEALKAGADFEEISILDLRRELSGTSNQDISTVYEGLLAGSQKHLRSYVNALKDLGIGYSPQHLSQKELEDIMK
jgi:hypothetical protein